MKKIILVFLLVIISLPAWAGDDGSVYDRIMRTGTIRCGYGLWSVYLNKDPNTGKMGEIYKTKR